MCVALHEDSQLWRPSWDSMLYHRWQVLEIEEDKGWWDWDCPWPDRQCSRAIASTSWLVGVIRLELCLCVGASLRLCNKIRSRSTLPSSTTWKRRLMSFQQASNNNGMRTKKQVTIPKPMKIKNGLVNRHPDLCLLEFRSGFFCILRLGWSGGSVSFPTSRKSHLCVMPVRGRLNDLVCYNTRARDAEQVYIHPASLYSNP